MFGIHIDKAGPISIVQQLTAQIRRQILDGQFKNGEKLPPTRELSKDLHIARNSIVQVYEQLLSEGYLVSRVGSGTFVAELENVQLDQQVLPARQNQQESRVSTIDGRPDLIRFHAGNPDSSAFPRAKWAALLKETCLDAPAAMFEYAPAMGMWQLRFALCRYLFRAKGIQCTPDQILTIPGAARGIDLLSEVFRAKTDTVAVEDPSIDFVKTIFLRRGFSVYPVPADQLGMETSKLPIEPPSLLIYTVPSHQFPIGAVMPVNRRLHLLEYARQHDAYIIEDDYDSEFRYQGGPIQSLRHLDPERVLYLGSFSKIFSPGLNLGYMIVPLHLLDKATLLMEQLNMRASTVEQLTLARFIEDKLLDRHVYKMKKVYEKKRAHLIQSLQLAFGDKVLISGENAGLHVLVSFTDHEFSPPDFIAFLKNGVEADWVEDYACLKGFHENQLVLGYGNLTMEQITEGIRRIREVLSQEISKR